MRALYFVGMLSLLACHRPSQREVETAVSVDGQSAIYQGLERWLCHPKKAQDVCHQDLRATEILPDNTKKIVEHTPQKDPAVDCFYVYPTVDLHLRAGNHVDLEDTTKMADAVLAQAARFTEACAVYAPLYRQVSIGTYRDREKNQPYFDVAYSDVADAFRYYLKNENQGRRVILIGHSQGAQVVIRLLQEFFDQDEEMRSRLVVAMPIGFDMDVAKGSRVGGSFQNLPVCEREEELGCVVSYRSYPANVELNERFMGAGAGRELACVAPNGAGGPLSGAYFPTERLPRRVRAEFETPFVLMRDFYSGRCVERSDGRNYLEISQTNAPGDKRWTLVELEEYGGLLGLHVFDMQFTQGDLIELAKKKIAIAEGASGGGDKAE